MTLDEILSRRLLIVSGKGGTGKSTVASALALLAARRGLRVCLVEVNTASRIPPIWMQPPASGGDMAPLAPGIWVMNLIPREALREYAIMTLKYEALYKMVFENRIVSYFLQSVPALAELTMTGKLWYHTQNPGHLAPDGSIDLFILDAPASGHAVYLLDTPATIAALSPEGRMRDETRAMAEMFADPRTTQMVLIALPEELPVNETIELYARTRGPGHVHTGMIAVNGMPLNPGGPPPPHPVYESSTAPDVWRPVLRRVAETKSRYLAARAEALRLGEAVPLPASVLPYLPEGVQGVAGLEALANQLAATFTPGGIKAALA